MDDLPFIDVHARPVRARAEDVWTAMVTVLRRTMRNGGRLVWMLRGDPAGGSEEFSGRVGETVPGFRVAESAPHHRLALRGHHRFSSYALTLTFDGHALRAESRAAFPGTLGRVYRAVVVGSGAHRVVVRGLLERVARAAEAHRRSRLGSCHRIW
jgi:hypothetical protein